MHKKVKRKVRQIKEKTVINDRLSVSQWKTLAAEISNSISDLPLATGNFACDLENLNPVTPNRLCLGQNNDRRPTRSLPKTSNEISFLEDNEDIFHFDRWFKSWLIAHVPKLMHQPKCFDTEHDVKKDDVVLFLKQDGVFKNIYQFG